MNTELELLNIPERLLAIQKKITTMIERQEARDLFFIDNWVRENNLKNNLKNNLEGSGRTCVLSKSQYFDQAGVNYSHVKGSSLPPSATAHRPELAGRKFEAMGVSVVIHPKNPYAPTSHFNVRFFQALPLEKNQDNQNNQDQKPVWWIGGGFDLTPYYGFEEDCVSWHEHAREAVKKFGEDLGQDLYSKFKKDCDTYFYLKHRQEPRGIGGLFFDDFNCLPLDQAIKMLESITEHYVQAYELIISKRKNSNYTQREIDFQRYRRGRYVEFNLIYDRGTLFGLQSGGRTESILMSLPPEVNFRYNWAPEKNSPEAELYEKFLITRDWV